MDDKLEARIARLEVEVRALQNMVTLLSAQQYGQYPYQPNYPYNDPYRSYPPMNPPWWQTPILCSSPIGQQAGTEQPLP